MGYSTSALMVGPGLSSYSNETGWCPALWFPRASTFSSSLSDEFDKFAQADFP